MNTRFRRSRSAAWAVVLAAALAVPALSHAQSRRDLARAAAQADPQQVRQMLQQSGMTPEQLRAQLPADLAGTANPDAASAPAAPTLPRPEPPIVPDSLAPNPRAAATGPEPFGFEIFRWAPSTFEPMAYGPVDPDYPLGPGDELALTLWGDDQMALTLQVSREGVVTLPEVGQLSVNGLTLEAATARVRAALSRVYSGLRAPGGRATTFVTLSLARLRTIQVFLLGDVTRPGSYTVSSVSRVLNALYAGGGPTRDGSLRDVRVIRGGRVVARADLYDVILSGESQPMARLENGDVVFVPPASRRVAVAGPVRRPGLFELKNGEHLRALMTLTGGPRTEADLARAQINRVVPQALRDSLRGLGRVALDVRLGEVLADSVRDVTLFDADSLTLFALPDRRANTVNLTGRGVLRPGVYEYREGLRVSDLVAAAGGLTPDAYLERAQITRTAPDSTRQALRFVPSAALAGDAAEDLPLRAMDDVSIRSRWDLEERQPVTVHGLVRNPGRYELLEGMTLADLLLKAGGFTDDAYAVTAELARVRANDPTGRIADTLRVPLARELANCREAAAMRLQPHDAVFIRRDPTFRTQAFVTVEGEVQFPGTYALLREDERVADLVRRAGGLTDYAYARGARFVRGARAQLALDLPRAMRSPRDEANLVLVRGDTLHVPRFTPTVSVEGAVLNPVVALYQPGAGVGFYVTQASGYRQDADKRGVVVMSPSGHVRKRGTPEPGSRVIVPARLEQERADHLKDFATLMSILASAATTVYLVGQSAK